MADPEWKWGNVDTQEKGAIAGDFTSGLPGFVEGLSAYKFGKMSKKAAFATGREQFAQTMAGLRQVVGKSVVQRANAGGIVSGGNLDVEAGAGVNAATEASRMQYNKEVEGITAEYAGKKARREGYVSLVSGFSQGFASLGKAGMS